jgi:flagellar biosynthesis protein
MKEHRRPRIEVVALRHERHGAEPPRVVAKGRGETAERVLELARKHAIPVRQDGDLLELLAALDVGDSIPTELFAAVAEVLAYLYRLNGDPSAAEPRSVPAGA